MSSRDDRAAIFCTDHIGLALSYLAIHIRRFIIAARIIWMKRRRAYIKRSSRVIAQRRLLAQDATATLTQPLRCQVP